MTNKRIVPVLLAGLALAGILAAPTSAAGAVKAGFKLGYNALHLRPNDSRLDLPVDRLSFGGFCAGPVVSVELTRYLGLQAELTYFQKGGRYEVQAPIPSSAVSVDIRETRKLSFIEVPFLLKLSFPVGGGLRPALLVGPSMGINLSGRLDSRLRVKILGVGLDLDERLGVEMETGSMDLSLLLGGGFDAKLQRGTIIADARICLGLTPYEYKVMIPTSKFASLGLPTMPDLYYDLEMSTFALSVSFGYLF